MCLKKKVKQWMLKYSKKSLRVCVSVLMFVVVCREGMKKRKVNITIIRIFVYSAHCCQKILQCIRICIFNKNETTGKFQLNGGFSFMHKCIVNVWNIIFKLDKREISSISWTCTITLECLKHTHTHTHTKIPEILVFWILVPQAKHNDSSLQTTTKLCQTRNPNSFNLVMMRF
jgi:hypothetical protein